MDINKISIMDKYYYLVSQLPYLKFREELNFSKEIFIEEAEKWLSKRDFLHLSNVNLNNTQVEDADRGILREFKEFEAMLRRELAVWRRANKNGEEIKTLEIPLSLIKDGNPLEVEINLLQLRWNFIDEKELDHNFDIEFLILYYLKLQILERLFLFDKEKGEEIFNTVSEVDA